MEEKGIRSKKKVGKILKRESEFINKVSKVAGMKDFVSKLKVAFQLLKDWYNGKYKAPWKLISAIGFAILYFLIPTDAIPDFIAAIGFLDDASVLAGVFMTFSSEIEEYIK